MLSDKVSDEVLRQAKVLAREHHLNDPSLVGVYVVPSSKEVRLVEVSASVDTTHEVIPFRFGGQPNTELPLDMVLVLVSEEEYRLIQDGVIDLPDGWGTVEDLVKVDFGATGD